MKRILFGTTMYGSYVNIFLQYCWPSLLAKGNLPALLKEYHVQINIHTDAAGKSLLLGKLQLPEGVDFVFIHDINPHDDKYEQLGRHQNFDLREAKRTGADYHCLMPDFIYSENCFAGVLKSEHKAICRLVISTSKEAISPALDSYRGFGTLSIPAQALATLSLKYMHPGIRHWHATKVGYPETHVLVWEGENTLHMCSPHCTPVYIANEVINNGNNIWPLDGILDKVIIGDIYCTKPDDGIVIVEVSADKGRKVNDKRVDIEEFCRIIKWDMTESFRQLSVFNSETIDPICRKMLGDTWWNDVEISVEKNKIVGAILQSMGVKNAVVG